MILQLKIIGILFILLASIHIVFPKYFSWREDLASLSLINRQMMIIHTFFIALVVFLMGLLCLFSTDKLLTTSLGKDICLGFAIFWSIRLIVQFVGYSSELWRGKSFETTIHIFFSLFWLYLSCYFWYIFLIN